MTDVTASSHAQNLRTAMGTDCVTGRTLYERLRAIDPEYTLAEVSRLVGSLVEAGQVDRVKMEGSPYGYRLRTAPHPSPLGPLSSFKGLTDQQRQAVGEALCRHLGRRYGGRWVIRSLGENDYHG